jgi:hypothetical protein
MYVKSVTEKFSEEGVETEITEPQDEAETSESQEVGKMPEQIM